jgi:hypothetical protein
MTPRTWREHDAVLVNGVDGIVRLVTTYTLLVETCQRAVLAFDHEGRRRHSPFLQACNKPVEVRPAPSTIRRRVLEACAWSKAVRAESAFSTLERNPDAHADP